MRNLDSTDPSTEATNTLIEETQRIAELLAGMTGNVSEPKIVNPMIDAQGHWDLDPIFVGYAGIAHKRQENAGEISHIPQPRTGSVMIDNFANNGNMN